MDSVAKLRSQRQIAFLAASAGIAAAIVVWRFLIPDEGQPLGLYVVYWGASTLAAGVAIQVAYTRAISSAARLAHLEDIVAAASSVPTFDDILERLGVVLHQFYGLRPAAYYLCDEAGVPGPLVPLGQAELTHQTRDSIQEIMTRSAYDALESRQALNHHMRSLSEDQQIGLAMLEAEKLVMVPLIWQGLLQGMACFSSNSRRSFTESDRRYMGTLGEAVAGGLRTSALEQARREAREEVASYNEITSIITEHTDMVSSLHTIAQWLSSYIQADGVRVTLLDPEKKDVLMAASDGLLSLNGPYPDGTDSSLIKESALAQGGAVLVPDLGHRSASTFLDVEAAHRIGASSVLGVPITSNGSVSGVITVVRVSQGFPFTSGDERKLATLASYTAIALDNVRLYLQERKRREEMDQLARFKTGLLQSVTHELRTSLSSLKAATELLSDGDIVSGTDYFTRLVQSISRNVARQESLVSDIADMDSLDSAALTLHAETLDVGDLIAEAGSVVAPLLSQKGQMLSVSAPPGLPPLVADRSRLSQVLVNLISNAHKYGPSTTEITLEVERRGDRMVFTVTDRGPGVPAHERHRIFDAFYRVQKESDSGVPGSGLGLAIAKSLVELHQGSIWVEDGPEGGAAFKFTLPVEGHE